MLNNVNLMGRICNEIELRRTASGTAVTSFTLAVDRDFKNSAGEKETDFFDIVCWNNTAEFVSQYFRKGMMAVVSGRLQGRSWTDKDGNKRKTVEVRPSTESLPWQNRDTASGSNFHSACSIIRRCKASGVSFSITGTAF